MSNQKSEPCKSPLIEERGEFIELPNGIMFKRGYVVQRGALNRFNAFESLYLTVEAGDHGVVVNYRLGLKNALRDIILIVGLIVFELLVLPALRGVLLAVFTGGLAYAGEADIYWSLELRARAWLQQVAQAPVAVVMSVGDT